MSDIQNSVMNNSKNYSVPALGTENSQSFNIEGDNSDRMKVKRPKITANYILNIPAAKTSFSDKEANKRIQEINTDIYIGAKKEKSNNEFNLKRYFTIFGILALLTAAFTCFRRK